MIKIDKGDYQIEGDGITLLTELSEIICLLKNEGIPSTMILEAVTIPFTHADEIKQFFDFDNDTEECKSDNVSTAFDDVFKELFGDEHSN